MSDARFEDGAERPLRVVAFDAEDLEVLSSLAQDGVVSGEDMRFSDGQFGLLLNRPRREVRAGSFERVRAALVFSHVQKVRSSGFSQAEAGLVLSLLRIEAPQEGQLRLIFAGDGEILLQVETIEAVLRDLARPHRAVSGRMPVHPLEAN